MELRAIDCILYDANNDSCEYVDKWDKYGCSNCYRPMCKKGFNLSKNKKQKELEVAAPYDPNQCNSCEHQPMCAYKSEYAIVYAAIKNISVNDIEGYPTWMLPLELKCKYHKKATCVQRSV